MVHIHPSWIQYNEKTEMYDVRIKRDITVCFIGSYFNHYDASSAYVKAIIEHIAISRKERGLVD